MDKLLGYPVKQMDLGIPSGSALAFADVKDLYHPSIPANLKKFQELVGLVEPDCVVVVHERYRDTYHITPCRVTKVTRDQIIIGTSSYSRRTGRSVGPGGGQLNVERWLTIP